MNIHDWINALEMKGCKPQKRRGKPGYKALCPAHQDDNPSLSVKEGDEVDVVVTCFAGCSFESIRDALGITPPTPGQPSKPRTRSVVAKAPEEPPKPRPLPNGPHDTQYIYPAANGEVFMAVVRHDYPTGKRFTQWTPLNKIDQHGNDLWLPEAPEGAKPLWRLPEVVNSKGRVAIVEGEKCVLAALKAWPTQVVTCWAGGTNSWDRTDWEPLRGREVAIVADGDKPDRKGEIPGHKCALAIADHLLTLGCTVMLGLPDSGTGDVADWLEQDGVKAAAKRVKDLLKPYTPAAPATPNVNGTAPPEAEPLAIEALQDNAHYRLLGLNGDTIAVRLKAAGRVITRSRESVTQPATLISLAPAAWWQGLLGGDNFGTNGSRQIGDSIIRASDNKGQIDMSSIMGRGAAVASTGKIVYHLGDRLLIDGQEVSLDDSSQTWLAEARIDLGPPASGAEMKAIAEAVMGYRWATPEDGKRLLGWMAAAIVGGALEWRPHLMLSAPAAQGKSWLLKHVVERLMSPLLIRIADATPASLARLTAHHSLPIVIDEAEPDSGWVIELLKLLRIASGAEGLRVRADPSGDGVVTQAPRFAAMLSSTAMPRLQRADASRLTAVRFGAMVKDWPAVSKRIKSALEHGSKARDRIIRSAEVIATSAAKLADMYQAEGMDSREAMATAALTAGWRAWGLDKEDVRVSSQTDHWITSDASEALSDILAIRVRQLGSQDRSVLDLMACGEYEKEMADLYGLRRVVEGLAIAPAHKGLTQAIGRSRWASVDIKGLLLQLKEAAFDDNPRRFGQMRTRAVVVPVRTLVNLGIDLWVDAEESEGEQSGF